MTDAVSFNVTAAHITRTPGVAGGKPCIAGRRIRVRDVYEWHEILGLSADEIAATYDLSLAQVYAALTYAFEHIDEIQADLREERETIAASLKRHPSKIQVKREDE
jgi:uncharacterized protein (DUF433 family)